MPENPQTKNQLVTIKGEDYLLLPITGHPTRTVTINNRQYALMPMPKPEDSPGQPDPPTQLHPQ